MPVKQLRACVLENVDISQIEDRWLPTLERNRAMVADQLDKPRDEVVWMSLREAKKANLAR